MTEVVANDTVVEPPHRSDHTLNLVSVDRSDAFVLYGGRSLVLNRAANEEANYVQRNVYQCARSLYLFHPGESHHWM